MEMTVLVVQRGKPDCGVGVMWYTPREEEDERINLDFQGTGR